MVGLSSRPLRLRSVASSSSLSIRGVAADIPRLCDLADELDRVAEVDEAVAVAASMNSSVVN